MIIACRLGDLGSAVWGTKVGRARGQAQGVDLTPRVKGTEGMFSSVVLDLKVVGGGIALRPVAKDHFVFGVFELEALQHVKW